MKLTQHVAIKGTKYLKRVSLSLICRSVKFKYIILHNVDIIQKCILGVDSQCDVFKKEWIILLRLFSVNI